MVNIRQKGQSGERQVQGFFNNWIDDLRHELHAEPLEDMDKYFQRNQNQSAVGGDDLTNPFALSIEVKRQEKLSVNSWWQQCVESAERLPGNIPILIYKQNRKSWRVRMPMTIWVKAGFLNNEATDVVGEIDMESLEAWFKVYAMHNFSELLI